MNDEHGDNVTCINAKLVRLTPCVRIGALSKGNGHCSIVAIAILPCVQRCAKVRARVHRSRRLKLCVVEVHTCWIIQCTMGGCILRGCVDAKYPRHMHRVSVACG